MGIMMQQSADVTTHAASRLECIARGENERSDEVYTLIFYTTLHDMKRFKVRQELHDWRMAHHADSVKCYTQESGNIISDGMGDAFAPFVVVRRHETLRERSEHRCMDSVTATQARLLFSSACLCGLLALIRWGCAAARIMFWNILEIFFRLHACMHLEQ